MDKLEQTHELKKEASALCDVLHRRFMEIALPIARSNPRADMPVDLEKLSRVLDKAHKRYERRTEAWADVKWPWRVEIRIKTAQIAAAKLGSIKSARKAKSSAENGKKGGRPRIQK